MYYEVAAKRSPLFLYQENAGHEAQATSVFEHLIESHFRYS